MGFPKFPSSPAELCLLLQLYLMGLWFFMRHLDWVMLVKFPLQSGKCHCLALPFHPNFISSFSFVDTSESKLYSLNRGSTAVTAHGPQTTALGWLSGLKCCTAAAPLGKCAHCHPPVCTVRPSVVINGQRADCFNPACQLRECAAPPFLCQERIGVLDGA